MKVQLLVSEWCQSCHLAEKVWREVAEERAIDFAVVDMGQPEGRELVSRLRLKTIPALIVDGVLKAIGVQSKAEALGIVASAPARAASTVQHIGLSMSVSGRLCVHSSMIYLLAAGGFLALRGGLFLDSPARVAPLHLFTLGFLTFLIYALGEHMLPRFTGNPIRLGAWTWTQFGLAHAGVLGFVAGLWLWQIWLMVLGAGLAWLALLVFLLRLWPVLWPREYSR